MNKTQRLNGTNVSVSQRCAFAVTPMLLWSLSRSICSDFQKFKPVQRLKIIASLDTLQFKIDETAIIIAEKDDLNCRLAGMLSLL
ncbi:MAG: hypothetical protein QM640_17335 [Niabella sp.]